MLRVLFTAASLLLETGLGCEHSPPPDSSRVALPVNAFDPATAGTIEGQVIWEGDLPDVPPFEGRVLVPITEYNVERVHQPNPNAPVVDLHSGGVGSAVVFLRGVDPQKARPWHLPPVRVDQSDFLLHVRQGDTNSHYGFVRRGDEITMVSTQALFHALHAQGADFFTLVFPDPNRPRTRCLEQRGLVELTSAAGYFWMRSYLFVDDHPYYVRTDSQGRFVLPQVPPGEYEIVCWLPSWHKARHERDPESGLIARWHFRTPIETTQSVKLLPASRSTVAFRLRAAAVDRDN